MLGWTISLCPFLGNVPAQVPKLVEAIKAGNPICYLSWFDDPATLLVQQAYRQAIEP
jgi:hypothetical protein